MAYIALAKPNKYGVAHSQFVRAETVYKRASEVSEAPKLHEINEHQKENLLNACFSLLSRRKDEAYFHAVLRVMKNGFSFCQSQAFGTVSG